MLPFKIFLGSNACARIGRVGQGQYDLLVPSACRQAGSIVWHNLLF